MGDPGAVLAERLALPESVRVVELSVLAAALSLWLELSPVTALCASEMSEAG